MNTRLWESTKEIVQTLGGLLYADKSARRIPEKDWVEQIQRIAAGDTRALGTLFMWTHGIVFGLILRITKDRRTAEKVTLEVFHEVWNSAASYDANKGSVVAWIMRLARTRALLAREANR